MKGAIAGGPCVWGGEARFAVSAIREGRGSWLGWDCKALQPPVGTLSAERLPRHTSHRASVPQQGGRQIAARPVPPKQLAAQSCKAENLDDLFQKTINKTNSHKQNKNTIQNLGVEFFIMTP